MAIKTVITYDGTRAPEPLPGLPEELLYVQVASGVFTLYDNVSKIILVDASGTEIEAPVHYVWPMINGYVGVYVPLDPLDTEFTFPAVVYAAGKLYFIHVPGTGYTSRVEFEIPPTNYLYNGVELPDIKSVQIGNRQDAFIKLSTDGSFYVLCLFEGSAGITNSNGSYAFNFTNPSWKRYDLVDGAWVFYAEYETSSSSLNLNSDKSKPSLIWTSVDAVGTDGTVYMEASKPVPVGVVPEQGAMPAGMKFLLYRIFNPAIAKIFINRESENDAIWIQFIVTGDEAFTFNSANKAVYFKNEDFALKTREQLVNATCTHFTYGAGNVLAEMNDGEFIFNFTTSTGLTTGNVSFKNSAVFTSKEKAVAWFKEQYANGTPVTVTCYIKETE